MGVNQHGGKAAVWQKGVGGEFWTKGKEIQEKYTQSSGWHPKEINEKRTKNWADPPYGCPGALVRLLLVCTFSSFGVVVVVQGFILQLCLA